jgi:hypothetical protein
MTAKYLIWSNEHNGWWCPNHCGYTSNIERAGRYDRKEAITICNSANYGWNTDRLTALPEELPIEESIALELKYKTI